MTLTFLSSAVLLLIHSFSFCMSEKNLFQLVFEWWFHRAQKCRLRVVCFSPTQYFKYVALLSSHLHCFQQKKKKICLPYLCFSIPSVPPLLFSGCFEDFLLITRFEQFDCDVSRCGFSHISSPWLHCFFWTYGFIFSNYFSIFLSY